MQVISPTPLALFLLFFILHSIFYNFNDMKNISLVYSTSIDSISKLIEPFSFFTNSIISPSTVIEFVDYIVFNPASLYLIVTVIFPSLTVTIEFVSK